jgi:hypothetical protein
MTATVDGDQLAVLRQLRAQLGEVEVLEVLDGRHLGRSPASLPDLPAPAPVATHRQGSLIEQPLDGPAPASTCSCHASDLYAALWRCPSCGHRSFEAYTWVQLPPGFALEGSCERRRCGYEGPYRKQGV